MARLLLIAFDPADAEASAGFGAALGLPYDTLLLTGSTANPRGDSLMAANLAEIPPADALAAGLLPHCSGYSHIAAVSSMRAKDVVARLAGLLGAAMVTDAIGIESATVFRRPMVAGSVIATVEVLAEPVVLTFRPSGFPAATPGPAGGSKSVSLNLQGKARRVAITSRSGARPDLTAAKVVVSGGRPLKDPETFERLIGGLADKLGGAAGATRAAVDSGIAANELQVGQTGKIVAPDLYIAAGISGSTQHMAGIKDSKLIVAINKDPDAPIFDSADLGIVADLYDVLPALMERV